MIARGRIHRLALVSFLLGAAGIASGGNAEAEPWRISGRIAAEARGFTDSPAYDGQSAGGQVSWIASPEFDRESADARHQFRIVPFARLDGADDERSHFDLREAYWRFRGKGWDVTAGFNRIFWGVAESHHLVDVINQTDLVEDIDGEEKLGQPMIQFGTDRSWGRLEAFALTGFRERTFPGSAGRLRAPLPVDDNDPVYDSGAGRRHLDAALRWSHYFGGWDVGAHWFRGTDREPLLVPDGSGERLVPHYSVIHQTGVDVQYTRNAWLLKLETLARRGRGKTFGASVAGFEYTFYQVGGSPIDAGILIEYLYDGRDARAPVTIYDDDVFVGSRLAFNDPSGTQVLAGAIVDRADGTIAGLLEVERRVGGRIKLELEARWFSDVAPRNALRGIERDSHVVLRVSRFF